jgi:hypothetical protein
LRTESRIESCEQITAHTMEKQELTIKLEEKIAALVVKQEDKLHDVKVV